MTLETGFEMTSSYSFFAVLSSWREIRFSWRIGWRGLGEKLGESRAIAG
jgi:hypothetical protein